MRLLVCSAFLLLVVGCASTPAAPAMPRSHAFVPAPFPGPSIRLVSAPMESVHTGSQIGRADLEQARALLSRAHGDLEPRQWEALDGKLTAAERAFERFSTAAKASGQAAEVVRGAEGLAQAGRVRTLVEVLPGLGPLLVENTRPGCGRWRRPRGSSWWNWRPSLVRREHRPRNCHRENSPRPPSWRKTTRDASPFPCRATWAGMPRTTNAPTGCRATPSPEGMCM
jgi:hypothetical protein